MSTTYCFDRFEVQPVERRLLVDGQPTPIGTRAFDLLQTLIENPGRLITKNELLDRVWPGLVVEEANLHVQISSLRKLLGPKAIATIPGRGYRLAVTVDPDKGEAAPTPPAAAAAVPPGERFGDRRHNLPEASAPLIGRDADIEAVNRLLDQHRLVTLVGPSGIGKTLLAQAVARQRVTLHANGVWWVDLAALRTADQVAAAIAQAAAIPLGDGDAATLLRRALGLRDTLLVLDNCEHLINDVSHIAAEALAGAPKLRLLATSLESLKVAGEQIFRLDGLAVPPAPVPLEVARCFGAVQLLEQRAQAVDQRFCLNERSVVQAIELCRQLDGIALAIEMAAARLPVLGFDAVASHLGDRLRSLRNTRREAPARHQTLGATHDWSHALLADEEKSVLRRLAVFAGSFRLDAALAVAVAVAAGIDESTVLDALFGLVDKSMLKIVQLEPPRYRLLESTRLYAAQRLEEAGEAGAAMQRHCDAMARLAVELDSMYWVSADRELLRRFMADYDDLQVCYERACAAGWVDAAAELSGALTMLRNLRVIGAGRHKRLKSAAQLLPAAQGRTRAKLLGLFANTYVSTIQEVSRADAARELVALRRELGDAQRLYEALGAQAAVGVVVGDLPSAKRAVAEGRALEQPDWPARLRAQFTFHCGNVCKELGDTEGCARAMQDVLQISSRAGFDNGVWLAQLGLADAAMLVNDVPQAIHICRQAMDTLDHLNIECAWAQAAAELGAAQLMARRVDDARESLRKAQPILEAGEGEGLILSHVAVLCALTARPDDAARLLGCSDAWYAANQSRPNSTVAKLENIASAELNASLGAAEFTRLRALGAAMLGDQPYRLARSVIGVAPGP